MVVRITIGKAIRGALSYNERKVSKGAADLLLASGFSCDVNELGFSEKLRRFQVLTERNAWIKTNTLHLSLNFSPDERLSPEKMQMIAMDYMERIGFSRQPYLVYCHHDAHHPHVHIVTTTIQDDGNPIPLHNIGKERSEPARKAIEENFNLIKAENKKRAKVTIPSAIDLLPATYGKEETKHAITNIIGEVIRSYKFTSLTELNIILRQMNIVADRGTKNSRMYQQGGLVYSLIDKEGFRIGLPIKASEIYGKPTLKNLERKFAANTVKKVALVKHTSHAVVSVLSCSQTSKQFSDKLKNRNISLHFDQDRLGIIRMVYFVDHRNKATYTHQELGITLNDIYRLRASGSPQTKKSSPAAHTGNKQIDTTLNKDHPILHFGTHSTYGLMHILLRSETGQSASSGQIPKKKKKRKGPPH